MKKFLLIGNAYWVRANRRKAEELSRWFEVSCVTHAAKGHQMMGRKREESEEGSGEESYEMFFLEPGGNRQGGTRYWLKGLGRVIGKVRPDIILMETEPWALIFWQTWRLRSRLCPEAKLGLFSWENVRRPGLKGLVLDQVYKAAASSLDFVIAGNREAKALFERAGVPSERIHVDAQLGFVPGKLYANPDGFRQEWRSKHSVSDDAVIIGYCGRFVPEKGLRELVDSVSSLRQQRNDLEIELHLLGGGAMEEELRSLKYPWLRVHEPVPHEEVAAVLSAWDILVLPSKRLQERGRVWEEQFGHALLQGMGVGLLTLGSRSGAIPEVLGDDGEVLFAAGDAEALRERLGYFLANREIWNAKLAMQRARARDYYSFASIADRYVKHLETLGLS